MQGSFLLSIVLLLGASSTSWSQSLRELDEGVGGYAFEYFQSPQPLIFDDSYQIGDEWGKRPYSEELSETSAVYRRVAAATARVGGATGFYLGKFAGQHIVATNHHVCPSEWACSFGQIRFPLLGINTEMAGFVGTWQSIDLSLLIIEVSQDEEARFAEVAGNFAFSSTIYPGQEIITSGFGVANNSRREMVVNQDSDCIVFSRENEFQLLADPDEFNPGGYSAWSFANGCDVSHGDSGSAMVDRNTGEVIGIIWTGRIPKAAFVKDSDFLANWVGSFDARMWEELSYAVPAAKIADVLREALDKAIDKQEAVILESILGGQVSSGN